MFLLLVSVMSADPRYRHRLPPTSNDTGGSLAARSVVQAVTTCPKHHRPSVFPDRIFRARGEGGPPFQSDVAESRESKPAQRIEKGKTVKEVFLEDGARFSGFRCPEISHPGCCHSDVCFRTPD